MPPDPSSCKSGNEEIATSDVGVIDLTHSSDSEESADGNPEASGYTLIPQSQHANDTRLEQNTFSSDDEVSEVEPPRTDWANFVEEPSFEREWNVVEATEERRQDNLPLTDDHVEKIKSAMAAITLTTLPPWASQLSDNDLKSFIQSKINK